MRSPLLPSLRLPIRRGALLFGTVVLGLAASGGSASAQAMSDGTVYGEGNYFGPLVDAFAPGTCFIYNLAQWAIIGLSMVYAMWLAYKAANGQGQLWKQVFLFVLVAGVAFAPSTLFISGPLQISAAVQYNAKCPLDITKRSDAHYE
jgi:hypothetical protein